MCIMDIDLLKRLDKAVDRSKEITTIVGKLQSAFYTNDETAIEDYLELARTYSIYSLGELDATIQELDAKVAEYAGASTGYFLPAWTQGAAIFLVLWHSNAGTAQSPAYLTVLCCSITSSCAQC